MKTNSWKSYFFFVVLTEIVGALAGFLTRSSLEHFDAVLKSPLTPPDLIFSIVWPILFVLIGLGAARIFLSAPSLMRTRSLGLFTFQLIVNFFWSLYFFNLRAFGFSFFWLMLLWILILLMILTYWKTDKAAAFLQIPYFLWVTFAAYLNYIVWVLNR